MDRTHIQNLFKQDHLMQQLEASLVECDDHYAKVVFTVKEQHTQGHGTCHGGVIFTLADGAFAMACNTETASVGQHCTISYLKPGKIGDTLTATAIFKAPSGRSEIYDITVTNQHDEIIAEFRGISRMVGGK